MIGELEAKDDVDVQSICVFECKVILHEKYVR